MPGHEEVVARAPVVGRDAGGFHALGKRRRLGEVRWPAIATQELAEIVVAPRMAIARLRAMLKVIQRQARVVLGSPVVSRAQMQRIGQPPDAVVDAVPIGARPLLVPLTDGV